MTSLVTWDLYSIVHDPQPQMILRLQMIPNDPWICFAIAEKWLKNKTAYIFSFVLIKQGKKTEVLS